MYQVDDLDTVVEITDMPRPDVGAPLPLVLADDYRLLLAYLVSERDPNWDGSYVNIISPDSEGMPVAVVKDGKVTVHTWDIALSHAEFVRRTLGALPDGAWVGTIRKTGGETMPFNSRTFYGNQLPAP